VPVGAHDAEIAYEAVPNNDAVILSAVKVFTIAVDPER